MHTFRAFLLTRQWRDTSDGRELSLWAASEHGPLRIVLDEEEAVCFAEREVVSGNDVFASLQCRRRTLDLTTLEGAPVDALYFRRQRDLVAARDLLNGRGAADAFQRLERWPKQVVERGNLGLGNHLAPSDSGAPLLARRPYPLHEAAVAGSSAPEW